MNGRVGGGRFERQRVLLSAQTIDGSGEGQILLARMSESWRRASATNATLTARDITFPRGRRRDGGETAEGGAH